MNVQDTSVAPLDRGRLADVMRGNSLSPAQFLDVFRRATDIDAAAIDAAASGADTAQIVLSAHRIAGACRMIGALELASACATLAAAAAAGSARETETALAAFRQSRVRLDAWLDAMDREGPLAPAAQREGDLLCAGLVFVVAEDHDFQRGMIVRTLRRLGAMEVHDFDGSAAALDAVRKLPQPALLVLDLGLPSPGGVDVATIVSAERLPVSVILHSAQPEEILVSQVGRMRSCGVSVLGAIGKPLTEAKLAPLIAGHRRLVAGDGQISSGLQ